MSTASEMIDDLRDRLNDAADTQVPIGTKIRFLNRGQAAMFPKVYKLTRDVTTVLATGTFEYNVPSLVGTGKIISVEVESGSATNRYTPLQRYDFIPSLTSPILVLLDPALPSAAGSRVRITSADRLTPYASTTYAASQSETFSGPAGTEELPVLYAMGLATARALDDRMDYTRYNATLQNSAVNPNDIMQVSQFWFAQFELLLERIMMPLPVSRN